MKKLSENKWIMMFASSIISFFLLFASLKITSKENKQTLKEVEITTKIEQKADKSDVDKQISELKTTDKELNEKIEKKVDKFDYKQDIRDIKESLKTLIDLHIKK